MASIQQVTRNKVRGFLLMRGMTVKDWAEKNGFEPDTVRKVIRRHAGQNRKPHGKLTREILRRLLEEIGSTEPSANKEANG